MDLAKSAGDELNMRHFAKAAIAIVALVCNVACSPSPATEARPVTSPFEESDPSSTITGSATVTDGDTIRIGDTRIRFNGIDSPEEGKRCGEIDIYRAAGDALRDVIGSEVVACAVTDAPDRYGREVAQCRVGDIDLNEYMVAHGWARDWPRYSEGAYADEEATARAAGVGVWSASCPADLWGDRDYSR